MSEELVLYTEENDEIISKKQEIKPVNHLYETQHQFPCGVCNGTGVITETVEEIEYKKICTACNGTGKEKETHNLVPREWNRFTVTDGDWMQEFTLSPLSARDLYIASVIDEYSGNRNQNYKAKSGLYITNGNTLTFGVTNEMFSAQKPLEYNNFCYSLNYNNITKTAAGNTEAQYGLYHDSLGLNVSSTSGNKLFWASACSSYPTLLGDNWNIFSNYSSYSSLEPINKSDFNNFTEEYGTSWHFSKPTWDEFPYTNVKITKYYIPKDANIILLSKQEIVYTHSGYSAEQTAYSGLFGKKTTYAEGYPKNVYVTSSWNNLWDPSVLTKEVEFQDKTITLYINPNSRNHETVTTGVLYIY